MTINLVTDIHTQTQVYAMPYYMFCHNIYLILSLFITSITMWIIQCLNGNYLIKQAYVFKKMPLKLQNINYDFISPKNS